MTAAEVRRIQQMVCGIEIATLGRVHRCDWFGMDEELQS